MALLMGVLLKDFTKDHFIRTTNENITSFDVRQKIQSTPDITYHGVEFGIHPTRVFII